MRIAETLETLPDRRAAPRPIGIARAGVGLAALVEAPAIYRTLSAFSDPDLLALPRLGWLEPPGPALAAVAFAVLLAAAAAFAAGWCTRAAGGVLTGLLAWILLLDRQLYSNHLYLLLLLVLLLSLARSGAAFSVDARRRRPRNAIPGWPVLLMRMQVSIVYVFAAAAKLNAMFLSGAVLRLYIRLPGMDRLPPVFFALLAAASVATELFLALAFWSPRLRKLAFAVGVAFHLSILLSMRTLPDLVTFTLLMSSAYLAFFSEVSGPDESTPAPVQAPAAA